ncbi:MAG: hypothetical protein RR254_03620 [Muribaculaceae bacterium]
MKKILLMIVMGVTALTLTSCYNTRILVGDVTPKEPLVEINKEWNHGMIAGLVPLNNATMKAEEYVNNAPNYVVKTNQSFLNQLVSVVTCFIYTPTQTKYYIPLKDVNKYPKK